MAVSKTGVRTKFFDYLFGEQIGYLCIATASPTAMETNFHHSFFEWPLDQDKAAEFIQKEAVHKNVWFCVSLLKSKSATKDACLPGSFLWSDMDEVTPEDLVAKSVPATAVLQTSPDKYQGFWRLEHEIPPDVREDYSRKLTYYVGADKGGWACNKLMRVPYTYNHKYKTKPQVELLNAFETLIPAIVFEGLPEPMLVGLEDNIAMPEMPDIATLPDAGSIIYKYSYGLLDTSFKSLFLQEPQESDDWSARMWRLINIGFEARMEKEEVFAVAIQAQCNKYERDHRPIIYLWREVIKAEAIQKKGLTILGDYKPLTMPELVDPELEVNNFAQEYTEWASGATDAVVEYHELCSFMLLSSLLASSTRLEASFGKMYPNLWGLVLGDSTLTRKTTAMELALSFLRDIDKERIVATDGSPEGLITVISLRSDQVSVYYRDEVSGLFSAMNNKSYLSDMPELLTKLYDVPEHYSRVLRKEIITVEKPYFIFFGGGIQEKVYAEITDDYIISGFMPRFLIVNGKADIDKLRPVGPPNNESSTGRARIMAKLLQIYEQYCMSINVKVGESQMIQVPQISDVKLDGAAWDRFAEIDTMLTRTAADSPNALLAQPMFTRLGFSLLKMAMLIAACRGVDKAQHIHLKSTDLDEAAWYVQKWGRHTIDIINNAGITKSERIIDKIMRTIKRHPGCNKSMLMRTYSNLSSKEMTDLLTTISERGLVSVSREGKGLRFWAVE